MLVSELLSQVSVLLIDDTSNTRWANAELLDYYNDGGKIIVSHKLQANATTSSEVMVSGVKQTLPTGGLGLIEAVRNMGTDGVTAGRALTVINKEILDRTFPNWVTETATSAVDHYMYTSRNPDVYYVCPPSDGTGYLELVYGIAPTVVAIGDIGTTNVELSDDYINVLLDYILWRAFSKDSDSPNSMQRAASHKAAWERALGITSQAETSTAPAATVIPPQGRD
jgi:hypothetical protein